MDNIKSSLYRAWGFSQGRNNFRIINDTGNLYRKPYKSIPGDFIYCGNSLYIMAGKGVNLRDIAKKSILYTHYYKISNLKSDIMDYNGLREETIQKDMLLYVPNSIPAIIPDMKNRKKPDLIYTRGLYFTGNSAGSENFVKLVSGFNRIGINTVVFDAKDVTGELTYLSRVPDAVKYNTDEKYVIGNVDGLIRNLKQNGIYTIARIAVFRDQLLCKRNPALSIRSKRTGGIWNGSKEIWCDPTNKDVQDYNIQLAIELVEKGVDEIQFDYIRFPTSGDLQDAQYADHYGSITKEETITGFLKRAYTEISRRNALLSIDIFGVVAWEKEIDIKKTGQRIGSLSKYCDIISPMLYPSHFEDDFDGYPSPGDAPYHFIYEGCKKTKSLAPLKPVRPWLQAFGWRVSNFNEDYIVKQIAACRDSGAYGYLFWHASNSYGTVYNALERLNSRQEKDRNN